MSSFLDIVIAEDNEDYSVLLCNELQSFNSGSVRVHPVKSIQEVLVFLEKHTAHAILLDLNLEDSKGIATLNILERHTDIPIIILTGIDDAYIHRELMNRGYSVYIKPSGHLPAMDAVVQAAKYYWKARITSDPITECLDRMQLELTLFNDR